MNQVYQDFCAATNLAAKKSIPHVFMKILHCARTLSAKCYAKTFCNPWATSGLVQLQQLDLPGWTRTVELVGQRLFRTLTFYTQAERYGTLLIILLTVQDTPSPIIVPLQLTSLLHSFSETGNMKELIASPLHSYLKRSVRPLQDTSSNTRQDFTAAEFATSSKTPSWVKLQDPTLCVWSCFKVLVTLLSSFLLAPPQNTESLEKSSCSHNLKIQRGPKKLSSDLLLSVSYKILKRLIHKPIINPLLLAGWILVCEIQTVLLTQTIEYCFEAKRKAGALFVGLTALMTLSIIVASFQAAQTLT